MTKPLRNTRSRRLALVLVPVAGLAFVGGTVSAQAFTPNVVAEVQHFWECFGWMITDPDTHAANCAPGKKYPFEPATKSVGKSVPSTTTTTLPSTTTTTVPTTVTTTLK